MLTSHLLRRVAFTALAVGALLLGDRSPALAQQSPWTGVVADEARPAGPVTSEGSLFTTPAALSGDGRFMVFSSDRALLDGDTNATSDVFLRDRQTGELARVSVSSTGDQGDGYSGGASISRDGRFIAFWSCATNLVPSGNPLPCDAYVHDRGQGTTTLISIGPNGESQASANSIAPPQISADGRYVLFGGNFEATSNYNHFFFWVRDRDGDGDGAFDEPGESTTTQVSFPTVGDETLTWLAYGAISGDGHLVVYAAATYDNQSAFIGWRLFLHDRTNGTTVRVDQTPAASYGLSDFPSFSDTGELAYVTTVNNLVAGDTSNILPDLFVVDLATLTHTKIERPFEPWQGEDYEWYPSISANGHYLVYQTDTGVIAHDRVAGTWQVLSIQPDGTPDQGFWEYGSFPSINADGTAVAFQGTSAMLVDGNGLGQRGLFVATAVDVSPSQITASSEAASYSFAVDVPENVAWTLDFSDETGIDAVSHASGSGPATVDVSLLGNLSGAARDHVIGLGSKKVTIHQDAGSGAESVSPSSGPVDGGTEVTIHGDGFEEGATVNFDGAPAASVTWVSSTEILAVTPPHTPPQWVNVVVANPVEGVFEFANAFRYGDVTAPEITPSVAGTAGTNGWYVGDVTVSWSVTDPESAVELQTCADRSFTNNAMEEIRCSAKSDGGVTDATFELKLDKWAPSVSMDYAWAPTYVVGESVPVTFSCDDDLSGVASCTSNQGGAFDTSAAGEFAFTVTAVDEAGNTTTESVDYTVVRRTPAITWTDPSSVTYPSGLGGSQLNATADAPGSFSYSPAPGTILDAGYHQLSVTFTPTDQAAYESATATVYFQVNPGSANLTWPASGDITYGTALSETQLNATHNANNGTLEYYPPAGTVLDAGIHTLTVAYNPDYPYNYDFAFAEKTITVLKANPSLSWDQPSAIVYGTGLGGTQLNATANVAGTFQYSPAAGTVLNAGTHLLTVTFTPSDATNYNGASTNVTIVVDQATPTITWPSPAAITYGTRLSSVQLNATHNGGDGYLRYLPTSGTLLNAGTHTLSVTYMPLPPHNYASVEAEQTITVLKANPIIAWGMSSIVYGTAISTSQTNGQASVAGTFSYDLPPAGTVLDAGTYTFNATFTPTNQSNYNIVSVQRTLVVNPQTVVPSWPTPAPIVYGTPLGATQLNATTSVAGTLSYSPAAGTVLGAGSRQLLVTFTPDSSNYATVTIEKFLTVTKATPAITWSNPAGITYGTALSATQLSASASVAGSFAYTPAAGVVLGAGSQTLAGVFTPTDVANYETASTTRSIAVAAKALTVSANNASKVYGQALPAFTISGTGFVNGDTLASLSGTPSFSTSATATSAPGSYNVTPSGVMSANYTITFAAGTLTITKANTTVTMTATPSPSNKNQTVQLRATVAAVAPGAGTPTGTVQFHDNGVLLGTATLVNGVATLNKSFNTRGSHPLTATYVASTNFNSSVGSMTQQVN